jgi:hypothetical protein
VPVEPDDPVLPDDELDVPVLPLLDELLELDDELLDELLELDEDELDVPVDPVLLLVVPVDVPELLELDEDDPEHPAINATTAIPTIDPRICTSKDLSRPTRSVAHDSRPCTTPTRWLKSSTRSGAAIFGTAPEAAARRRPPRCKTWRRFGTSRASSSLAANSLG